MKLAIVLLCLQASSVFSWLSDPNLSVQVRYGDWISLPDNFDDNEVVVLCGVTRHSLLDCSCTLSDKDIAAKRSCDGAWQELNKDSGREECHTFTNAQTEGYIRPTARCQQLIVYPLEPSQPTPRLGPEPEVSCPPGYELLSCWMHADVMDVEFWQRGARLVRNDADNKCKVTGCKLCRVQASCFLKDIVNVPTLDTFP